MGQRLQREKLTTNQKHNLAQDLQETPSLHLDDLLAEDSPGVVHLDGHIAGGSPGVAHLDGYLAGGSPGVGHLDGQIAGRCCVVDVSGPLAELIIPQDVLLWVLYLADLGSIVSFSCTDKRNWLLLQEADLWKAISRRDFGLKPTAKISNWKETYMKAYWLPPCMSTFLFVSPRMEQLDPLPCPLPSKRLEMSTGLVGISTERYSCKNGIAENKLSLLGARFKFKEGFLEKAPPSPLHYKREHAVSDTAVFKLWEIHSTRSFSGPDRIDDMDINSFIFYYSPHLPKSYTYIRNYIAMLQGLRGKDRFYKCSKHTRTEQRRIPTFWYTPMVIVEFRCEMEYLSKHQYVEYNESFVVETARGLARKLGCPYVVANNADLGSVEMVFASLEKEYRKVNSVSKLGPVELGGKDMPVDPSLHLGKYYNKKDVKIG